jgi:acyl carrier protein
MSMTIKETILDIIKELMPAKALQDVSDIIDGGYIDSLELMSLISTLSDRFGIEIDVDDMTPENFNSVDAIASMVTAKKS